MKLRTRVLLPTMAVFFLMVNLVRSDDHHKQHERSNQVQATARSVHGTQKVCPISKDSIDEKVFLEYQAQKIYFCCAGCDETFLKEPEKYFSEMKKRGEVVESVQKVCPVSSEELEDFENAVVLDGRKVYVCCKKCAQKFQSDPSRYLKNLQTKDATKEANHHDHKHHNEK